MKKIASATMLVLLIAGCSMMAPNYSPSVKTIQAIKESRSSQVAVAATTAANPKLNKISMRGNGMSSPYGSYSAYIENALKSELSSAGLLNPTSNIIIGSTLTQNNLDTSMAKGFGDVAAIFSVTKDGKKIFEKEIKAHEEWESSFVAAIAIPNAVNAYPTLVNNLVSNLFKDPEFLNAISK